MVQKPKTMSMGQKKEEKRVSKFKGNMSVNTYMSVIDNNGVIAATTHYAKGIGFFHCFEGICCDREGPAKVKYIIPVAVYRIKNFETGEVMLDYSNIEIMYLSLNKATYEALVTINDTVAPLDTIDIVVKTIDDTFQKLEITPSINNLTGRINPASWRLDENIRNKVMKFYSTTYENTVMDSLGKTLTPTEYLKLKDANPENVNRGSNSENADFYGTTPPPPPPPPIPPQINNQPSVDFGENEKELVSTKDEDGDEDGYEIEPSEEVDLLDEDEDIKDLVD